MPGQWFGLQYDSETIEYDETVGLHLAGNLKRMMAAAKSADEVYSTVLTEIAQRMGHCGRRSNVV